MDKISGRPVTQMGSIKERFGDILQFPSEGTTCVPVPRTGDSDDATVQYSSPVLYPHGRTGPAFVARVAKEATRVLSWGVLRPR